MTRKKRTPCPMKGCKQLVVDGWCAVHEDVEKENRKRYNKEERNPQHVKFYASSEWQQLRKDIIKRDYNLCQECLRNGEHTLADVVDHIIELQDDYEQRNNPSNLECLCHACHNRKTAREKKKRVDVWRNGKR